MAAAQKNQQLADLGTDRRFEIATAEDKADLYIKFTERDLERFRNSVQNPYTTQLQKENQPLLAAWSSFGETVEDKEKCIPTLLNGQSHRARLHHEMREKDGDFSKSFQNVKTTQAPPPTYALGRGQNAANERSASISTRYNAPRQKQSSTRSLLDPALANSESPSRVTSISNAQTRGQPTLIQRRPARPSPNSNYVGSLADPSDWLEGARQRLSSQSDKPTQPVKPVQPVKFAPIVNLPVEPAQSVKPNQTETPQSVVGVQPPTGSQPAMNLEKQVFRSNLPQPQTSSSALQSKAQPQYDPDEDLLIALDSTPERIQPRMPSLEAVPDAMDLDDADEVESTCDPATVDMVLGWLQEIGKINDTLHLFDAKTKEGLIERRTKLCAMISEAGTKKPSNRGVAKQQERQDKPEPIVSPFELKPMTASPSLQKAMKTEPFEPKPMHVASPLQKTVKAHPFEPVQKSVRLGASVHGPMNLEASRFAPSKIQAYEQIDQPSQDANDCVLFWQKTLPKRVSSRPAENEPISQGVAPTVPKQEQKTDVSSPSFNKATKSLYQSRYAC